MKFFRGLTLDITFSNFELELIFTPEFKKWLQIAVG